MDQTTVGWYSSNFLSSFFTPDTIQHHARYQLTVPSAVLLVYDNIRTNQGHLALRALRLTSAAMKAYRDALAEVQRSGRGVGLDEERLGKAVLGSEAFAGLSPASVFESLPVRVRNLCLRSSAQGLFWTLLGFPPTILVLWMFVQNGEMSGLGYTIFKGIWAMFFVVPVFFIVFFAGLDKRNFPELEFEALMRLTAEKEGTDAGPPLVGQVGHHGVGNNQKDSNWPPQQRHLQQRERHGKGTDPSQ